MGSAVAHSQEAPDEGRKGLAEGGGIGSTITTKPLDRMLGRAGVWGKSRLCDIPTRQAFVSRSAEYSDLG